MRGLVDRQGAEIVRLRREDAWFTQGGYGGTESSSPRTVEASRGIIGSKICRGFRGARFPVHGRPPIQDGGGAGIVRNLNESIYQVAVGLTKR